MEAIRNFPRMENIKGIKAWFGIIEQVDFAFSRTSKMAPFRDLLQHEKTFLLKATHCL